MPNPNVGETQDEFMARCIPMMMDDGAAQDEKQAAAICYSKWEKKDLDSVTLSITPEDALKYGARNNSSDQSRLQMIHDYAVENGAMCKSGKSFDDDIVEAEDVIAYGDSVKAIDVEGGVKVGGYLVRFTDPESPDLTGDYFSKDTDFDTEFPAKSTVYFNHGMDTHFKRQRFQPAEMRVDDFGVWAETILQERTDYEKFVAQLAKEGKLGWSSGVPGHLVEREPVGKAMHIKYWPLGKDASLTHTPAEARNSVIPLKSLLVETEHAPEGSGLGGETQPLEVQTKEPEMDELELKAFAEKVAKDAADATLKAYADSQKEIKAGYAQVTEDEADRALKGNPFTKQDFFKAVYNAAVSPESIDKRLLPLKAATGANESVPSQGGFLVQSDIASGIMEKVWKTGSFLSLFNPITVSGNGLVINWVDETSRVDGSRAGGLRGYWLAEAGEKTASKPKFRQIDLKLKKVAALCYATDELLEDATALESWLTGAVPNELKFQVEAAIYGGDGVGKPLGLLNADALISAVRTDASEIDAYDLARMWAARYSGVNDYVWLVNPDSFPQLVNLSIGQMPVFLPPGGLGGLPYSTIFGRPVLETEYNKPLGTLGDIMLISPSQYTLITKGGVQSASSIHVKFTTDETAFRFVYRVDGQPSWASAVAKYAASTDYVSPYVALAAST